MRRFRSAALFAVLAALMVEAHPARGDVAEGRRIAEQWCAACHAIGPQRGATPDAAPPFVAMANDPAYPRARITGFLWAPHPPMPQFDLTREQINSLADYMESLRAP